METFDVEGFPETKLVLALYKNVKNATDLKRKHLNSVALLDAGKSRRKHTGLLPLYSSGVGVVSAIVHMYKNITAFNMSTWWYLRCQEGV